MGPSGSGSLPSSVPHAKVAEGANPRFAACLLLVAAWSFLFNVVGRFTWGWGPLSFAVLLLIFFLMTNVAGLSRWLGRKLGPRLRIPERTLQGLALLAIAVYVVLDLLALGQELRVERNRTYLIDIAANTYEAGRWFFDEGKNPYTHFSQVWDSLTPDIPNVTVEGDRTYLYGVPYYYGYPYFPMMFVAFEPFRQLVGDYNAMRWGNLVWQGVSLALIAGLCRALLGAAAWRTGAVLAALAYLSVRAWANELFHEGVTDLVIAVFGLAGFLAMTLRRPVLSGVFLGLAFASKLLPAPMWFVLGAIWWWRNAGWPACARFTAGFALVSGAIIGGFALQDPGAFVSATILFFLTSQGAGDNTSLWFFLPDALKTPLLAAGGVWIAGLFVRFLRDTKPTPEKALQYAFLTYLIFIAFNKQTHLNHLWSIYAMGCVALVTLSLKAEQPETELNREAEHGTGDDSI
jgi:hypothetical protein